MFHKVLMQFESDATVQLFPFILCKHWELVMFLKWLVHY